MLEDLYTLIRLNHGHGLESWLVKMTYCRSVPREFHVDDLKIATDHIRRLHIERITQADGQSATELLLQRRAVFVQDMMI